ncbi:MAG: glycoside hydrolase N-terminal domain-containing protein, partial [Armatimonadota bacterium]|nr:glycoside hydrolase N-terminal domain-containing protein [Armatimonadota bacterium]
MNILPVILLVSCAAAPFILERAQAAPAAPLTLWYQQPANNAMNEGLPIGNGRLGGVLFGGVDRERFQFNEDSLWTGGENPTGDYDNGMGAYQTFGDLFLAVDAGATPLVSSPSGQVPYFANEGIAESVDGRTDTKWCVEPNGKPVIWQVAMPAGAPAATSYTLTSCPDWPTRDPKTWEFAGSTDGQTWTVLDRREDQPPFEKRGQPVSFPFANTTAYHHYRLTVLKNQGDTHFQIAEISVAGLRP